MNGESWLLFRVVGELEAHEVRGVFDGPFAFAGVFRLDGAVLSQRLEVASVGFRQPLKLFLSFAEYF